jgi:hypothetical protein
VRRLDFNRRTTSELTKARGARTHGGARRLSSRWSSVSEIEGRVERPDFNRRTAPELAVAHRLPEIHGSARRSDSNRRTAPELKKAHDARVRSYTHCLKSKDARGARIATGAQRPGSHWHTLPEIQGRARRPDFNRRTAPELAKAHGARVRVRSGTQRKTWRPSSQRHTAPEILGPAKRPNSNLRTAPEGAPCLRPQEHTVPEIQGCARRADFNRRTAPELVNAHGAWAHIGTQHLKSRDAQGTWMSTGARRPNS